VKNKWLLGLVQTIEVFALSSGKNEVKELMAGVDTKSGRRINRAGETVRQVDVDNLCWLYWSGHRKNLRKSQILLLCGAEINHLTKIPKFLRGLD
jgi:hypothetical protein